MPAITPRSSLEARGLSHGAQAGISIGAILGSLLILLCVWPIVARRLRRHRRQDAAAGALSGTGPDAAAFTPMAEVHGDSDDRRMSADSYGQRPNVRPPNRQSTKELTIASFDGTEDAPPAAPPTSHPVQPPAASPEPRSPTQTDAELAQMVSLCERRGYSGSYYNTEIPSEAFGLDTSQPWESQKKLRAGQTRSSSKRTASSILSSLMRRASASGSKDSSGPQNAGYSQSFPQPADIGEIGFSESPTELEPPPNALTRSPEEQSRGVDLSHIEFPRGASPPMPPPVHAPPGTVNPMEVMGAMTSTEQTWRTNAELMNLSASPPSNPHITLDSSLTPQPTDLQTAQTIPNSPSLTSPPPEISLETNETSPFAQDNPTNGLDAVVDPTNMVYYNTPQPTPGEPVLQVKSENTTHPATEYNNGVDHQIPQYSHQRHPSSAENYYTDNSTYSTPYPAPSPSGLSSLSTPDTRITDATPSPRPFSSPESKPVHSPSQALSPSPTSPQILVCDKCGQKFDQPHKLNHHKRYHDRPHVCERPGCGKRFGTKTHLDRHVNDKHEQTRRYHCSEPTCAYSRQGGKSFPRKDNLRRHMVNIHHQSPKPDHEFEFVDVVMAGT